jgi:hypothetical protein
MVCNDTIMTNPSRRLLEQGHYQKVLSALRKKPRLSGDEVVACIGAHCFLGEFENAVELWTLRGNGLNRDEKIRSRFFLGVAATRISKFRLARGWFRENLNELSCAPRSSGYIFQGIGFYQYFVGKFSRATNWAEKASLSALENRDDYIRFLAIDLLGHSTVQLGERAGGIRLLRQAVELAKAHGNLNFASAFTSASLVYEAEAGWRSATVVIELETALERLDAKDSYTRNNLILELARQLTLRGQWAKARDLLNREAQAIYGFANRRQELVLQLRLAEILCHQGDRFAFEHFLQAARRCLNSVVDCAFEIRLLGLEWKAHQLYGRNLPEGYSARMSELAKSHRSRINDQILFRQGTGDDPQTSEIEDPIHHLFILNQIDSEAASTRALNLGYLGLWSEFSKLKSGENHFVVLQDGRSSVVSSLEHVKVSNRFLSRQQVALLVAMHEGNEEKAALIKCVWGYSYDQSRHDPLLHSTIAKLRKHFDMNADWIVTTETGWTLAKSVNWILPKNRTKSPSPSLSLTQLNPALNFRQIRALNRAPKEGVWCIQKYKAAFNVSTMTAFRDLTDLLNRNYLIKTGRGRSTRYHIGE